MDNVENNNMVNSNLVVKEKIGLWRIIIIVLWTVFLLFIMFFVIRYLKNDIYYYNALHSIAINGMEISLEKDVYSYNIDCNNCQYLTQDLIITKTHGKNTTIEKQVLDNAIYIKITGQKGGEKQYTFIF